MSIPPELVALPPWMGEAFTDHGFDKLTPIQRAVLADETCGRDLRIASATGSGKTVAVAMAVAPEVEQACSRGENDNALDARTGTGPSVLVVAPTRELAAQLQGELRWIYQQLRAHIALVLGGGAYGAELRALRRGPSVVVGTPGRLVDHLQRGSLDLAGVRAVVLDEADQLMELGFKAELDAILQACPESRRTLLVSATFGPVVRALADRHQRDALVVQGTPGGAAHADIAHVVHPIAARDQLAALANILLSTPPGRSLVFVAMRAQASQVAASLGELGFDAAALSGEMSQAERTRTLDAFRTGALRVLVATDVAARGIDVQNIHTVVHACPPRDPEALIHRSGRTGRAGQQGTSILMATPGDLPQVRRVLQRARIEATWVAAPGHAKVRATLDDRLIESVSATEPPSEHARELATRLLSQGDPTELVARLVGRLVQSEECAPQDVQAVAPPRPKPRPGEHRGQPGATADRGDSRFDAFEVNWGRQRGASPQRLLAMLCRRGRLDRQHLGRIDVLETRSVVEVDADMGDDFLSAMRKRDSRDRHIRVRRLPKPRSPAPSSGGATNGAGRGPLRRAAGGRGQR